MFLAFYLKERKKHTFYNPDSEPQSSKQFLSNTLHIFILTIYSQIPTPSPPKKLQFFSILLFSINVILIYFPYLKYSINFLHKYE